MPISQERIHLLYKIDKDNTRAQLMKQIGTVTSEEMISIQRINLLFQENYYTIEKRVSTLQHWDENVRGKSIPQTIYFAH